MSYLKSKGVDVSIHSFQAEGDFISQIALCMARQFQSTPSKRKETTSAGDTDGLIYVSIHSFQAEGDMSGNYVNGLEFDVSIHSFQAEGDTSLPFCL